MVGKSFRQIADERKDYEANTFWDLIIDHGKVLRRSTLIANHNPARLDINLQAKCALIGFSDAGAHLHTMAFYNFALCVLQ